MNYFQIAERIRLLKGGTLSQRIQPSELSRIRWIAVENLLHQKEKFLEQAKKDSIRFKDEDIYNRVLQMTKKEFSSNFKVKDFEVDIIKYECDDGLMPEDIFNEIEHFANTEDELYQLFEKLEIDASKFGPSWSCDYPY